jgi:hypothetical protein
MPLTLRPTRLSRDPDAKDWSIHEDGHEIAWFWSITVMGPARHKVRTDGRAPTLEEAKAQFAAAWEAFKRGAGGSDSLT